MKHPHLILVVGLIVLFLAGCAPSGIAQPTPTEPLATPTAAPTYTPQPTYTPAPTYTPVPTYTPASEAAGPAEGDTATPPEAPTPWSTPTPIPDAPAEVNTYVQEVVPYVESLAYGLEAMYEVLYDYSVGNVTIEDVNASLEIYNEIIITAYQGILAVAAPEALEFVHEQIVGEVGDVGAVLEFLDKGAFEGASPENLTQDLDLMSQSRDRIRMVDQALADQMPRMARGEGPSSGPLQLQLAERDRTREGRTIDRPDVQPPQIQKPDRPGAPSLRR